MKTTVPQLQIETHDDGTIDLEQDDGAGKIDRITLHPMHVRYLFEIVGHLIKPEPIDVPARIATLERRLNWLRLRFNECGAELPHDFYERCGMSIEFATWLDASCAVADEFCADLSDATKKSPDHRAQSSCQGQRNQPSENEQPPQTAQQQNMNAASGQQLTINL